ncbi:NAD(P)-dependent oxidoreductase [Mesorhizobium sp. M0938]|uniref:NAD-dependent epimerase/dehydratase family protein n=1 Tax=unclassified Mesorhizobium TaxID=325217 RepID=UPI0033365CE2
MARAVLVTGAAGFVGSRTAEVLRLGGYDVVGLDMSPDPDRKVVACDLCDRQRLWSVASPHDFAAIVHCGAISGPSLYRDEPDRVAWANILSTANLLQFARKRSVPRFVFASSASVYGRTPTDLPVSEERALHPSSVYAASKIAAEALLEAYCRQYDISGVSLRIAAVYGPGRRTACVIRDMILAGLKKEPLTLPFGRDQRYHYVHVDDAAAALSAAVHAPSLGAPAYTIAADQGIVLSALADLVREIVPGPPIAVGAAEDPLSDPQGPYELDAAARDLGWRPAIDLASGIRFYAEWLTSENMKIPLQINSVA